MPSQTNQNEKDFLKTILKLNGAAHDTFDILLKAAPDYLTPGAWITVLEGIDEHIRNTLLQEANMPNALVEKIIADKNQEYLKPLLRNKNLNPIFLVPIFQLFNQNQEICELLSERNDLPYSILKQLIRQKAITDVTLEVHQLQREELDYILNNQTLFNQEILTALIATQTAFTKQEYKQLYSHQSNHQNLARNPNLPKEYALELFAGNEHKIFSYNQNLDEKTAERLFFLVEGYKNLTAYNIEIEFLKNQKISPKVLQKILSDAHQYRKTSRCIDILNNKLVPQEDLKQILAAVEKGIRESGLRYYKYQLYFTDPSVDLIRLLIQSSNVYLRKMIYPHIQKLNLSALELADLYLKERSPAIKDILSEKITATPEYLAAQKRISFVRLNKTYDQKKFTKLFCLAQVKQKTALSN